MPLSPLWLTLLITAIAALLLLSGRIRADIIGLLVVVTLALTGLMPLHAALEGFSSNVVFVLISIFILTKGLEDTGVSAWLGERLAWLGSGSEGRLVVVTTFAAALLSLFMNTVAAAAVLLPPVLDVARRRGISPSRILIPLAYGTLLGGTATLLTTANLVTSASLEAHGFRPYGLFDFLPVGVPVALAGLLYMTLVGRHLLPRTAAPRLPEKAPAVEACKPPCRQPGWKPWLAVGLLLLALVPAAAGWAPLALTTLGGATLMMLFGIVPPDRAYRAVSWRVIFLIAGMIPLGVALRDTGAAAFLSDHMLAPLDGAPPWVIAAAFMLLTSLLTQITSGQVAALLVAPLAIAAAEQRGIDPRALGMAVAVGASLAFLLPTGHPSNLLVMGPGEYQPGDYFKVGLPLLLVVAPVAVVALQIFWL